MNPYWDAVKDGVKPSEFRWEGPQVGRFKFDWREGDPPILDRTPFVKMYSWSITDPESIAFVVRHQRGGLVDPMAGTGYWAYVLAFHNVDVVCYDIAPPGPLMEDDEEYNPYHKGASTWVNVEKLEATLSVVQHPDRTLFLSWPPYSEDAGVRALNAYKGNRVIYIGEGESGCTGSDAMHQVLEEEWREIAEHRPVQWWGLHDRITVFERKRRDQMVDFVSAARDNETLRPRTKRAVSLPSPDGLSGDVVPTLQRSE